MTQPSSFAGHHLPVGPNEVQRVIRDLERKVDLNASAKLNNIGSSVTTTGQQSSLLMNPGSAVFTVDGAVDSVQLIIETDPATIIVWDTYFTHNRMSINGFGWTFDVGSGELRALTDSATFIPLRASAFNVSSSAMFKQDVKPAEYDPCTVIKNAPAYTWRYRDAIAADPATHIGPMAEDLPAELVNDDGVDLRDLVGVLWEANRQLIARVEALEAERGTKD